MRTAMCTTGIWWDDFSPHQTLFNWYTCLVYIFPLYLVEWGAVLGGTGGIYLSNIRKPLDPLFDPHGESWQWTQWMQHQVQIEVLAE